MTRKCKKCGKILMASCDFCHAPGLEEDRNHPGFMRCRTCRRAAMPKGRPQMLLCHECELEGK